MNLEIPDIAASKTCRSPFAGFAGSLVEHLEKVADIEQMDLDTFAQAGLIVRVHSEHLGCDVLFVSDNVDEVCLSDSPLPVYRATELKKLAVIKPSPRSLQTLHEVKTVFDGAITELQREKDADDL